MPNWVKNIVTVSEDAMNKIKRRYFTENCLDFNKIIPMPKTLELESGSITSIAIFYAYICKDDEEKKKIEDILKRAGPYESINKRLQEYKEAGQYKNIYKEATKYKPSEIQKSLNISTLEELGDTYIRNIEIYGYTTWYEWCIENWGTKWNVNDFSFNNTTMIFYTAWATPEKIFEKISEELPNEHIEVKYADECYSNFNNGKLTFENGLIDYEVELKGDFITKVWDEEIENEINQNDITDEMFD